MICNECETVAHCLKNGCVPKHPSKDKALKLALEALEELTDLMDYTRKGQYSPDSFTTQPTRTAIAAIKQALAAPVQEPFGFVSLHTNGDYYFSRFSSGVYRDTAKEITAVYTTPPAAQPALKPLTDEEIIKHFQAKVNTGSLLSFADGVRYAEAAHGIKDKST